MESKDQDRTEKPTPYKLEQAKKKGQVAKSIEFSGMLSMLVFIAVWLAVHEWMYNGVVDLFDSTFRGIASAGTANTEGLLQWSGGFFIGGITLILPLLFFFLVLGMVFSIWQTGFVLSTEPIKPKFERLNFVKGFKKFFSWKMLFDLVKSLLKMVAIAVIVWIGMDIVSADIQRFRYFLPNAYASEVTYFLLLIAAVTGLILLLFSIFDLAFTRWSFTKQMMMSKKEVKDEHKKREGDPQVRQKQKSVQKELITKLMGLSQVKDADVVITNPTHIAVALHYDPQNMIAPKVVCSGRGFFAKVIRTKALQYGVRILRRPELARALIKNTPIGSQISDQDYQSVAEIYRELWHSLNKGAPA